MTREEPVVTLVVCGGLSCDVTRSTTMSRAADDGWRERLGINFNIELSDSDIDEERAAGSPPKGTGGSASGNK